MYEVQNLLCAGGEIASTFDNPGAVKLGRCKLIEEIMIGEDKLIHFSGTAMGEACTIVLRGASVFLSPLADLLYHDFFVCLRLFQYQVFVAARRQYWSAVHYTAVVAFLQVAFILSCAGLT